MKKGLATVLAPRVRVDENGDYCCQVLDQNKKILVQESVKRYDDVRQTLYQLLNTCSNKRS